MRLGLILAVVGTIIVLPKTELYLSKVQEAQTAEELSVDRSATNPEGPTSNDTDSAKSVLFATTEKEQRVLHINVSRNAITSPM